MFAKTTVYSLVAVLMLGAAPSALAQALSIDAVADRVDEVKKDKTNPAVETRRRSPEVEIEAIYGLGTNLRADLVVNGKLVPSRAVGSELPNGLQLVDVKPLEISYRDGKKIVRVLYAVSPSITESPDRNRTGQSMSARSGMRSEPPPPTIGQY